MFMSIGHDLGFKWNPRVHGPYDSGVVPLRNCAPAWAEGPVFWLYGLASHHAMGYVETHFHNLGSGVKLNDAR